MGTIEGRSGCDRNKVSNTSFGNSIWATANEYTLAILQGLRTSSAASPAATAPASWKRWTSQAFFAQPQRHSLWSQRPAGYFWFLFCQYRQRLRPWQQPYLKRHQTVVADRLSLANRKIRTDTHSIRRGGNISITARQISLAGAALRSSADANDPRIRGSNISINTTEFIDLSGESASGTVT